MRRKAMKDGDNFIISLRLLAYYEEYFYYEHKEFPYSRCRKNS